jgi:hypothetical protein
MDAGFQSNRGGIGRLIQLHRAAITRLHEAGHSAGLIALALCLPLEVPQTIVARITGGPEPGDPTLDHIWGEAFRIRTGQIKVGRDGDGGPRVVTDCTVRTRPSFPGGYRSTTLARVHG